MAIKSGSMHVVTSKRRHGDREYETVLVRRSYREGARVRKQTLANLSHLPPEAIDAVRRVARGETLVAAGEALRIERSLGHGHVAAVLGVLRDLDVERLLARERCRERDLCVALICQRFWRPAPSCRPRAASARPRWPSSSNASGCSDPSWHSACFHARSPMISASVRTSCVSAAPTLNLICASRHQCVNSCVAPAPSTRATSSDRQALRRAAAPAPGHRRPCGQRRCSSRRCRRAAPRPAPPWIRRGSTAAGGGRSPS